MTTAYATAAQSLMQRLSELAAQRQQAAPDEPIAEQCIAWIERHFYAPETQGPISLAPYQKAALRALLAQDESGALRYSMIVWSDIKKSIKSTIAAAVVLFWADTFDWSMIKIVANDLKQADSRVGYYARRCIEMNQAYFVKERGVRIIKYKITFGATNSIIEAVPIDPGGEAGGNDDIIVYTELWAAHGEKYDRMWTETTLSPTKFGRSFRWVETYAGFTGESAILERLYDNIVKEAHRDPALPIYRDDASRAIAMWNTEPRLPWQTPEYYAQERAVLTPSEFARVHQNQWVQASQAFVPPEWWARQQTAIPPLESTPYEPLIVALDGGVSDDNFALVIVSRHASDRNAVAVRRVMLWRPSAGGTIVYSMTDDDVNYLRSTTPYAALLSLWHSGANIVQVCLDPYQLHDMRGRLMQHGIPVSEFNQAGERLRADKALYDLIRDRRIWHNGDADLTAHIQNANAQTPTKKQSDEGQSLLRLVKRRQEDKIDAAVALSMAAYRCMVLPLA